MKGLHGKPQNLLWDLRDRHRTTEPVVIAALVTMIDRPTLDQAIRNYRASGLHAENNKRPYTRQMRSTPQPRRTSKYNFAALIDDDAGRVYRSEQFKVTPGCIVENARGFARRWDLDLQYEKGKGQVHIWLKRKHYLMSALTDQAATATDAVNPIPGDYDVEF